MHCKNIATVSLVFFFLFVRTGSTAEKRHADTHVHGAAEMNIVVDGKKIVVEFRSPAEGVMGFEHEAKTDADKKKRDAAMKAVKERFSEMVVFDKKLGCRSQPGEIVVAKTDAGDSNDRKHGKGDHKKSGEHRELRATHNFTCNNDPAGSRVRFGVTKLFPNVHELKVQVLSGSKQLGVTIKKDKGEVGL
jgi:hypothetical protein